LGGNNVSKIIILGISASPRHGNTEALVKEALMGAAEVEGVQTKFIGLAGRQINPCKGCVNICHPAITEAKPEKIVDRPWHLCPQKDVMHEVWDALVEADGIILGTPVYYGEVSAQLKAIMDRCTSLARIMADGTIKPELKYKVGGAIAVAGCRNGGQERALTTIVHFFMFQQMFPVGLPEVEDQAWGVAGCGNNPGDVLKDKWASWFGKEVNSVNNARKLGKSVVTVAREIKGKLI
jgi:multimeric flavodoxin WrbA